MKKILLISTGGTLASSSGKDGLRPGIGGSSIAEQIRGLISDVKIDVIELFMLDSSNIQPEEWSEMAACIYKNRKEYDGIVIIHGTDTMAYTAAALSFALQHIEIPVVLTGSQVPIENTIADATENCRAALHMAVSGCPGVFVAFNRKIIMGTRASKTRTRSFDAFESIDYPYAARINSSGLVLNPRISRVRKGVCELQNRFCTDVFVLKLFPGITPDIFRLLREGGIRGVYVEGFGIGGLPFSRRSIADAIRDAVRDGMVVIIGSQCLYEGSDYTVYEAGREALDSGAVAIGNMTTEAAVAKLMWAFGKYEDPDVVREVMTVNIAEEMGTAVSDFEQ